MSMEVYEARNSIYCYEGTNVLINNFNIHDNKKLQEVERKIVLAKLFELRKNKQIGQFDKKHLVSIHKFLFEDIYPFAGKFRTENIAKGYFSFAEWEYIESELDNLLNKLKEKKFLKDENFDDFVNDICYFMSELNVLHPFREGNGRAIREFIRELAYVNGYLLDFSDVDADDILQASMKSVVDDSDLKKILRLCLKKIEK